MNHLAPDDQGPFLILKIVKSQGGTGRKPIPVQSTYQGFTVFDVSVYQNRCNHRNNP